jgi:hypothetical protein
MRRMLLSLGALAVAASVSFAGGNGGVAPPDPYYVNIAELPVPPNQNDSSLSQTAAQTIDISKTNLILIQMGQSNWSNAAPSLYTPANASAIFQLNIYNGKIYPAVDPLLGTTNTFGNASTSSANPALRLADQLITNGNFQRIYIVPASIVGSHVADWDTGLNATIIPVIFRRIVQKGIACNTTNVTCVVTWGQGEADVLTGTQPSYTVSITNVISKTQAAAGYSILFFVAQQTYFQGATNSGVVAAQAAVVNHGSGVWAGPNADALVGNVCGPSVNAACRQVDNVHWSDNGSYSIGVVAWLNALHAFGAPF